MDLCLLIFWFGFLVVFEESVFAGVVIKPVNATVSENDPVTLTCTLTESTENAQHFSWYLKKSSEPVTVPVGILTSSCHTFIVSINTSLYGYACPSSTQSTWTIKKVTRQNHGNRFHCNIETSSGNQNSGYTFLDVQGSVFAKVVITPVNPSVSENDPVTLRCTLNEITENATSYSWYLTKTSESNPVTVGTLISPCQSVFIPINASVYGYACPTSRQSTWTIKKVTRQNRGDRYQCNIETLSGNQNSAYTFLNVQVPIAAITMTVPSTSTVTVRENESEEFKCKTSEARPAATVTWYKDSGTPGDSSDDAEITSIIQTSSSTMKALIEVNSTLRYSPTKNDNGWRIYCTASNIDGQTPVISQAKPLLNVQFPPDGPPVIIGLTDGGEFRVVENTQGQLTCSLSGGNPTPTLTWDCINSGTPQTTSSGTVTKTHTWTAQRGQDKNCTCQASHYSGKNTDVSIRIHILYPPTKPTFRLKSTTVSGTIKIMKNNPLSVLCASSSDPVPTYKWTYPNKTTSDGPQLNVSSILNSGNYTCHVQNTMSPSVGADVIGDNFSSIGVLMLYPPVIRKLKNMTVVEGSPLTVSCPVTVGHPSETTFEWTKNGQVWKRTQEFTIDTTTRTDAMFYTCTVANTMQQTAEQQPVSQPDTKSLYLNVFYETTVTSFFIEEHHGQSDIVVTEHDTDLQFTCTVDSNPVSTVKITLEGNILKEQSNTASLSFTRSNVACLNSGVYVCEGYNNYGHPSSKNLTLFVKCSPRPLHKTDQNITSYLHVPATLSFTVLAYPEPGPTGFSWHKENGNEWTPILSNADLLITSSAIKSNLTILNTSEADFGRYRLTVTNSMGSYAQYMFLTEKGSSTAPVCQCEKDLTSIILGITLGIACAVLAAYAAAITILFKRKTTNTETRSTVKSSQQTTYANVSFKSDVAESQGQPGEQGRNNTDALDGDEDSTRQYTDLVQYSNDDRTTYEVLHSAE